ncbi:MAG: SMC-Scp complex subunit ScpB [Ruminococcaceae bacterium]|nr:SMC-Scp complex subunit ScpB [Oscillospiraceae bacterium]
MSEENATLTNISGAIEAILYAAGHPIAYEKLSEVLGLSVGDVKSIVEAMSKEYNSKKSTRGILLLMYPDSCQFSTKEEYMPYIREALGIKRGGNLSNSTMEALAVVAYNQPVTRSYVDSVRGVDSSYAMTSLIDKNLIACCGRLDAPGRPMLYATTEKFLRVFGLNSLDELPQCEFTPPAESDEEGANIGLVGEVGMMLPPISNENSSEETKEDQINE